MRKKLASGRSLVLGALWVGLIGCGLESELPSRTGGAAPVNSGVTLSGAGVRDDADAGVVGDRSRITDIESSPKSGSGTHPGSGGMLSGVDSGGAFDESVEESAGGAMGAPPKGGGAGAGGNADPDDPSTAAGAANTQPKAPPTLWFSEYVEGSSSNKALEITALAHSELEGCKVSTYFNGKAEATVVAILTGLLEAGRVLTLCTSTLKEKLPEQCTQVGNLTFNGDDAIALSCDGTVLDVIGQLGVDPGAAWGAEPSSTADHTLRRNCRVQSGDPLGDDDFDPTTEWHALPVDTFDGLGTLGC